MEKLLRDSTGGAITLSGQRGVMLRSSVKTRVPVGDGEFRDLPSFTFKTSAQSDPIAVVWDNQFGLAVLDAGIASFLLTRRWGSEVSKEAFDWWNAQVDAAEAPAQESEKTPVAPVTEPVKPDASKQGEPKKADEPKNEPPKQEAPKPDEDQKEKPKQEAPKPVPGAVPKTPAATKAEALARAEQEEKAANKK